MRKSQAGPTIGLIAQVLLLAVMAATVGLGAAGWVVGLACAVTMAATLARGLARGRGNRLEPASWVTLARATLTVGVAALVGDSFAGGTPVGVVGGVGGGGVGVGFVGWVVGAADGDGVGVGGAV